MAKRLVVTQDLSSLNTSRTMAVGGNTENAWSWPTDRVRSAATLPNDFGTENRYSRLTTAAAECQYGRLLFGYRWTQLSVFLDEKGSVQCDIVVTNFFVVV